MEKGGEDREEMDCKEDEELMEDTRGNVEALLCCDLKGKKKLE